MKLLATFFPYASRVLENPGSNLGPFCYRVVVNIPDRLF